MGNAETDGGSGRSRWAALLFALLMVVALLPVYFLLGAAKIARHLLHKIRTIPVAFRVMLRNVMP